MNIIRGFVSILGSKVAVLLLGVIITPLVVRFLGSAKYGDYAFLMSVLGVTMILSNAGIFDGTRKYIAEERPQSDWVEQVFGFYLRVAIILAIAAAMIYGAFSHLGLVERFLGSDFVIYFYLLGMLIVVRQANSVVRGGLMGLGLEDKSEPLRVLSKVVYGIVALSLLYLGLEVSGVLIGHLIATLLIAILGYVILFRHIDKSSVLARIPKNFPRHELLSFNVLSIGLILLTASLYHVDILLLRLISGDQATGFYRASLVVAEFLWFVPVALQTVLLHSSSNLWSQGRANKITNLSSKVTRFNLSLVLLLAIGLAALAGDFLPLYFGAEFEASVLPLLILLPGAVGFAIARPIFAIGQGKGALRILIVATGAAATINLLLNLLLIPPYGNLGAAIATSIGYGLMVVLHVIAARRIGFNPIQDLRLVRLAIVAIISAAVIFGTANVIESSIVSLVVIPPLGFAIYSVLTLRLGVVKSEELSSFITRLPEPVQKHLDVVFRIVEKSHSG